MSTLDISEKRKPQDGKIEFGRFGPLSLELRVATIPTANGLEDVVMRLLAAAEPLPGCRCSFAGPTCMSRGSGTAFFSASTSAITLTAISGGVLLPM